MRTLILEPFCDLDQAVEWLPAFAPLSYRLGDIMGDPVECPNPADTSDDILQQTTSGLALPRAARGTPTFTDGTTHWALTPSDG